MVTLRIGSGVALPGAGAAWPGGDAVADGDFLGADEDVLDEQPQDALAFFDGGGGGVAVQLGEEAFEVIGELEVGVTVGELGGDVVPDDIVEVIGADRLIAADPAAFIAVIVAAQAPVVVNLLVRGPGR